MALVKLILFPARIVTLQYSLSRLQILLTFFQSRSLDYNFSIRATIGFY